VLFEKFKLLHLCSLLLKKTRPIWNGIQSAISQWKSFYGVIVAHGNHNWLRIGFDSQSGQIFDPLICLSNHGFLSQGGWLRRSHEQKPDLIIENIKSIFIKQTVCTYVPLSSVNRRTNFAQTSTLTQGRLLTQVWPRQPNTPDPGVPQTPKPKRITGEKTLLYKKCIKFFPDNY